MVNLTLAVGVTLLALISLQAVDGCGFLFGGGGCGGGCRPRPSCCGGRPSCCGGSRPPPCCGGSHSRPCGGGFLFGRPLLSFGARPQPAPRPQPIPVSAPRPKPCGFLANIGHAIGSIFGCGFRPNQPNAGTINIAAPPPRPPPISGSDGEFSWHTVYENNIRYIIFRYKNRTQKYFFNTGGLPDVRNLLQKFQISFGWRPTPTVEHTSVNGNDGPFSWTTNWVNGRGTVTFYYKIIVNGAFKTVKSQSFPIQNQDPSTIQNFLNRFQSTIDFSKYETPPQKGPHVTYELSDGKIKLYYKYYVNGQLASEYSREYHLHGNSDGEINRIIASFMEYCKENVKVTTTVEPEVTGKINWETKYEGGQQYMYATYTESKGDKVIRTVSKKYPLSSGSEDEIKNYLEQFKASL